MSYTPINWQTGDVITAEKLNKMDNGWGIQDVQLFSETVTTVSTEVGAYAELAYYNLINADSITVTFDGTDYECTRISSGRGNYYGGFGQSGPDFSEYPFCLISGNSNAIYTESTGEHTVAVTAPSMAVSDTFKSAINSVGALPLLCVSGVTTSGEMLSAWTSGRLLYFKYGGNLYVITNLAPSGSTFMPSASLSITFDNSIFTVSII